MIGRKYIIQKNVAKAIIGTFLLINISACSGVGLNIESLYSGFVVIDSNGSQADKWTWMFYSDSDFVGYVPMEDFAEEAYSGKNLDVIILQDFLFPMFHSSIYYIDENHNLVFQGDWGEVNMGNYKTLKKFILYCKNNYPADRYFLSVYNHGAAWQGACADRTNLNDILTMNEFQKGLNESGGVDILCFTGACNMGNVECVYELRELVDVYIGSEDGNGYGMGWHGIIDDICSILNSPENYSNIEIGEQIIQLVEDNELHPEHREITTVSAMRTDTISDLAYAIDLLSVVFSANITDYFNDIKASHRKTRSFGNSLLDIYDFVYNYREINDLDETLYNILGDIMCEVDNAVIAEWHGKKRSDSHGLTIYFPIRKFDNITKYHEKWYGLDFPQDTNWDEFLRLYIEKNIRSVAEVLELGNREQSKQYSTILIQWFLERFPLLEKILSLIRVM